MPSALRGISQSTQQSLGLREVICGFLEGSGCLPLFLGCRRLNAAFSSSTGNVQHPLQHSTRNGALRRKGRRAQKDRLSNLV